MRRAQISIHAAREGGDTTVGHERLAAFLFQSTPPVKAATVRYCTALRVRHISIHAAREGGDAIGCADRVAEGISIHAAREGGDLLFSR